MAVSEVLLQHSAVASFSPTQRAGPRAEGPLLERLGQIKTLTVLRQLGDQVVGHRAELIRRRAALTADLAEYLPAWRFVQPRGA